MAIKNLNNKTSSGIDGVSNVILKNLTPQFKLTILSLFNKTLTESRIPADWKKTKITMIPKKNVELENPKS